MLNPVLQKKYMDDDVILLYGKKLVNPNFKILMASTIRGIRRVIADSGEDLLAYRNRDYFKKQLQRLWSDRTFVLFNSTKSTVDNKVQDYGKWHSIEFECIFKNIQSSKAFQTFCIQKKYHSFITIKEDRSVRPSLPDRFGQPKEVVVSYKTGDEFIVEDVCKQLNNLAYVNSTCGTHVHFDMRNQRAAEAKMKALRLSKCVPFLKLLLPPARRNSNFCEAALGTVDRYAFVNFMSFAKYQTIEVRGHQGTLNAEKILNWIALCEKIMFSNLSHEENITSIGKFLEKVSLNSVVKEYVLERYNKFNSRQKARV